MAQTLIIGGSPGLILRREGVTLGGDPTLIFDWRKWGVDFTALVFVVVNTGDTEIVATPEMSPDGLHVCTLGAGVPKATTLPSGQACHDPYGVDIMAPYWRLWVSGTGTCDVYVFGISRGTLTMDV